MCVCVCLYVSNGAPPTELELLCKAPHILVRIDCQININTFAINTIPERDIFTGKPKVQYRQHCLLNNPLVLIKFI